MDAAWIALIAALVGSAIGGVVGAWLQIRHERHEGFRGRMLEAADDAATALGTALADTRAALSDVEDWISGDVASERATESARRAQKTVDDAGDSAGRIDILFGLDNGLGDAVRNCRRLLRRALNEAGPTPPEVNLSFKIFTQAETVYRDFVRNARATAIAHGTMRDGLPLVTRGARARDDHAR